MIGPCWAPRPRGQKPGWGAEFVALSLEVLEAWTWLGLSLSSFESTHPFLRCLLLPTDVQISKRFRFVYEFDWIFMLFGQHLGIYTLFCKKPESEVKKCKLLGPGSKKWEKLSFFVVFCFFTFFEFERRVKQHAPWWLPGAGIWVFLIPSSHHTAACSHSTQCWPSGQDEKT